jgi:peptide/nickel transport system permease protein
LRVARYLAWRVARGVLTLLIMIAVTVGLYRAIEKQPPTQDFFPDRTAQPTQAQTKLIRHLFELDRSPVVLYLDHVSQLARGDIGHESTLDKERVVNGGSVGASVYPALRATLSILIGGVIFVLVLALPLGAIAGSRVGSWSDRIISFVALVLVCTHPMMLGLILKSAGGSVDWLPTSGYCTFEKHAIPPGTTFVPIGGSAPCTGGPVQWATHLILPWLTFALLFLALYTRMVRASVAETIHEDFVRTARAKGASQARVLARHVVPTAGLRVLTMVGMEIGTAIGVSVYIETAFNIFGLGKLSVAALAGSGPTLDLPLDLAIVVLITLVVVVGNLVVDLLYALLDPRVGVQGREQRTKSLVGGVF